MMTTAARGRPAAFSTGRRKGAFFLFTIHKPSQPHLRRLATPDARGRASTAVHHVRRRYRDTLRLGRTLDGVL